MRQLWLTAKLDIVESLRARWFLIYSLVFGGIVALLFLFGLTDRNTEAVTELRTLLGDYPAHAEGHGLLARILAAEGQDRQALAELDRVLDLQPSNVVARYARARLYAQQGQLDAAAQDLAPLLSAADAHPGVRIELAKVRLAQGRTADAVRRLTPCSGHYVTVEVPRGQALRKAEVIKEYLAADVLINVSVAKDHEGTRYACVLKNAMGALTYGTCQFFHFGHGKGGWYGDVEFLSQCVADLNLLRKPDLAVADATTILTSNGPFGPGKLAKPNVVVAGASAVSVDAYCTRFLGLDAKRVSMIVRSAALGLGEMDPTQVKTRELNI